MGTTGVSTGDNTVAYNTAGAIYTIFDTPAEVCETDTTSSNNSDDSGGGGSIDFWWLFLLMLAPSVRKAHKNQAA